MKYLIFLFLFLLLFSCEDGVPVCVGGEIVSHSLNQELDIEYEVKEEIAEGTYVINSDKSFEDYFTTPNAGFVDFASENIILFVNRISENAFLSDRRMYLDCNSNQINLELDFYNLNNNTTGSRRFWSHAIIDKSDLRSLNVNTVLNSVECDSDESLSYTVLSLDTGTFTNDNAFFVRNNFFFITDGHVCQNGVEGMSFIANSLEELSIYKKIFEENSCLQLDFEQYTSFDKGSLVVTTGKWGALGYSHHTINFSCNRRKITITKIPDNFILGDDYHSLFIFPLDTHISSDLMIECVFQN